MTSADYIAPLLVGKAYDRPALAGLWALGGIQAICRGVYTPARTNLIFLFVTRVKQSCLTPYQDFLHGEILQWEGESQHVTDKRIASASVNGDEVHLFYREIHHAPFDPARSAVKAGRLVLERVGELSEARRDFGFETTLSGRGYLAWLEALRSSGYRIHLYYVWAPGVEVLTARIRQRVAAGGHFVPDNDVIRRRERSLRVLKEYVARVDKLRVFDNSGLMPLLVYEKNGGAVIHDAARFEQINREIEL